MESATPLVLLALGALAPKQGRYVGDLCTTRTGVQGICRSIDQCPQALDELHMSHQPVLCSFDNFNPIICCPYTRAATRMCKKYGEAVYRYDSNNYCSNVRSPVNQCNMKKVPFIIGGTTASPNEYPHMALVGYGEDWNKQWSCGGSLISNRFVLTAAHCILTPQHKGPPKWVRLGELNLNTTEDSQHEDFDVVETFINPEYVDGILYNDIGLLKLDRDVLFTASIRPACLHPLDEIQDKLGIASGWGITNLTVLKTSEHLMKVNLHLLKNEVCNSAYKTQSTTIRLQNGIVEDSMVCGGSPEGGIDTCRGDSGGPLQIKLSSPYCMYSLIGITSFGKRDCGAGLSPAIYTRVSYFLPWVESVVWPLET